MSVVKPYIPPLIAQMTARHTPAAFVEHFAPGSGLSANAVASQLWLDQWRAFLGVGGSETEMRFYGPDRAGVPFNLANFQSGPWSGQQRNLRDLSPENIILEASYPKFPDPSAPFSKFTFIARALINSATGEMPEFDMGTVEYARIYPFPWLIDKFRKNFPEFFLNPRLTVEGVAPIVRAALFLKGELPISFTTEPTLILNNMEPPVVRPWHDLSYLATTCTRPGFYPIVTRIIQAAFWAFPEEELIVGEGMAESLNQTIGTRFQFQDSIDRITQAALAAGVDVQTVDRFRIQTALD